MKSKNMFLLLGGICSFIIAFLHIAVIIGGEEWYRFFGAGEEMALMSRSGSIIPAISTSVIVIIFAVWGIYAFSGAGIIRKIPPLKLALVVISVIYILRGLGGIPAIVFSESSYFQEYSESTAFVLISSVISLVIGLLYTVGTLKFWSHLSNKSI